MNVKPVHMLAGAAVLAAVVFVAWKGARGTGAAIGGAAVDVVEGAAVGVVEGIGEKIGVPRTNETACQKALREGRTLDASFACPASDFIRGTWNSLWD
jgi:hypothetical protein